MTCMTEWLRGELEGAVGIHRVRCVSTQRKAGTPKI